jgi:IS30 family transposase
MKCGTKYTDEEIAYINQNIEHVTQKEIAKRLGRSERSINRKVSQIRKTLAYYRNLEYMRKSSKQRWANQSEEERAKALKRIVEWQKKQSREKIRAIYRKYAHKKRQILLILLGSRCDLCGKECCQLIPIPKIDMTFRKQHPLEFHEKHFNKHDKKPSYILKHKDDFAPVCKKCHIIAHALHEALGLSYGEIKELPYFRLKKVFEPDTESVLAAIAQ